jgi:hypothetical protein
MCELAEGFYLIAERCHQCTRCLALKDVTEFSVCGGVRHRHCKPCRSAYGCRKSKERTARRRALGLCRPVGRPPKNAHFIPALTGV